MASANITMGVKGIDKTGAAFTSIKNRARVTGAQIRSIMGGAIAAAGAYLSFRSVASAVKELGALSDMSMKAGMSVDALSRMATAFEVGGLNIGVASLTRAMQYLQKSTGGKGEGAFWEAVKALSAIEDPAKRGAALVQTFGRAGLEMQPLINAGDEVIERFRLIQSVMPGVSQAAADAGDAAADSLTTFSRGAQSIALKVVGKIAALWGDEFPGGVRAGALNAVNWVEWGMKKMYNTATKWGAQIGLVGQAIGNVLFNDYTWEQAWSEFGEVNEILTTTMDAEARALDKARADFKASLAELKEDDLANMFGPQSGARTTGETFGAAAAKRIQNALTLAGSNQERRIALLGPEYQNEAKKQTEFLKQIAKNTDRTATNTEGGDDYPSTDL